MSGLSQHGNEIIFCNEGGLESKQMIFAKTLLTLRDNFDPKNDAIVLTGKSVGIFFLGYLLAEKPSVIIGFYKNKNYEFEEVNFEQIKETLFAYQS